MKRLSALAALVTMTFLLAACGGGQASQDSGVDQEQSEPTTRETAEATQPPGTTQASDEPEPTASGNGQEEQEGQEDSGYSVTTMDGGKVSIGGGDATALFFMAGY